MGETEQEIKKVGAKFLLDSGLLFRINQQILHPFGLALEIIVEDNHEQELKDLHEAVLRGIKVLDECRKNGETDSDLYKQHLQMHKWLYQLIHLKEDGCRVGGIWDYREDPEGMLYGVEGLKNGMAKFEKFMNEFGTAKLEKRNKTLGYVIQEENSGGAS